MKKVNHTTKINWIVTTIITIFILLSGCKKELVLEPENLNSTNKAEIMVADPASVNSVNCQPECERTVDLIAGQNIKVGTVNYKNNTAGTVDVTYTVHAPWKLLSVSLYIGDCGQIPTNSAGNTVPGQYPYKPVIAAGGVTSITIQVPRQSVPTCGCIAAHASVIKTSTGQTETAWGEGTRFTYTNWAMYYQYCLQECPSNCGYPDWYWFVDATTPWPMNSIAIGNHTYSKTECYDIVHTPDFNPTPDVKECFMQVCAAKLSSENIESSLSIWDDVTICKNYIKSIGHKLTPGEVVASNQNARDAADRIKLWLKANKCYGK